MTIHVTVQQLHKLHIAYREATGIDRAIKYDIYLLAEKANREGGISC